LDKVRATLGRSVALMGRMPYNRPHERAKPSLRAVDFT
jgi:hypothetical protein